MKYKLIILAALLIISTVPIMAQTAQRVAVLDFEAEDRASRTTANQMMHSRRGDFINILNDYDQYELISQNEVSRALTAAGISSVRHLTAQLVAEVGQNLEADIVVWGTISEISSTEIRVLANVMSVRSQNIHQLRFNARKRSADRVVTIRQELVAKIGELVGGEVLRLFDIGEQQLNAQNFSRARETFERIVELEPQNIDAWFYLGYITFMLDDFDASIDYCEAGLEIAPDDERILNNIVEANLQAGRYECALGHLKKMADLNPDDAIWMRISNIYFDLNDTFQAIEALQKAVEINPESERAHYALGTALFDNNEIRESIPHLEFIAERDPEDDLINRKLTAAYMRTDQLGQAIQSYRNQIERNPQNVTAYLNLAGALRTQEKNREALDVLNRLHAIQPNNPTVHIRLADIHLALNNNNEAERYARQAQNLDADAYEPYTLLAQVAQLRGYSRYEDFLKYEEESQNAFGAEADRLIALRGKARSEANTFFVEADRLLQTALTKTTQPAIERDINARRRMLEQLITETQRTFFD